MPEPFMASGADGLIANHASGIGHDLEFIRGLENLVAQVVRGLAGMERAGLPDLGDQVESRRSPLEHAVVTSTSPSPRSRTRSVLS